MVVSEKKSLIIIIIILDIFYLNIDQLGPASPAGHTSYILFSKELGAIFQFPIHFSWIILKILTLITTYCLTINIKAGESSQTHTWLYVASHYVHAENDQSTLIFILAYTVVLQGKSHL